MPRQYVVLTDEDLQKLARGETVSYWDEGAAKKVILIRDQEYKSMMQEKFDETVN